LGGYPGNLKLAQEADFQDFKDIGHIIGNYANSEEIAE
jgi:hypothetical protein